MGRGYSASRSKSGRLTVQRKRERSNSLKVLKDQLTITKKVPKDVDDEETVADSDRQSRSVGAEKKKSASRARSASLLSKKIQLLEEELGDVDVSENEEETVSRPDVMTKYKAAGRCVDETLDLVASLCVAGANTKVLCDQGDEKIAALVKPLFSKVKDASGAKLPRGISFPTTVSVNEVLCNHSPYREEEGAVLRGNDVVKIHVGCHVDGYPVSAARTVVVESSGLTQDRRPLDESAQHAIEAARLSLTGMIHSAQPGALNAEITDFIARIGHHFQVQAVEGVLSNRTKRWVPDGIDCIIGRRVIEKVPQQDVGECEVDENQVWNLDIAFTNSPQYRVVLAGEPTTIFRRTPEDFPIDPRVQQASLVLKEISENHFCFPFHYKGLSNPLQGRMGIRVLLQKGVVEELPVLRVKPPYITARFSATIAITSKRVSILCGLPSTGSLLLTSATSLPDDLQEVLQQPLDFNTASAQRRQKELEMSAPAKKRERTES